MVLRYSIVTAFFGENKQAADEGKAGRHRCTQRQAARLSTQTKTVSETATI